MNMKKWYIICGTVGMSGLLALTTCAGYRINPKLVAKDTVATTSAIVQKNAVNVQLDVQLPLLSSEASDLKVTFTSDSDPVEYIIPVSELDHNTYMIQLEKKSYTMNVEMPTNPDGTSYTTDEIDSTVDISAITEVTDTPAILITGEPTGE